MRIDGAWRLCDDGVVRPVLYTTVLAADGNWVPAPFLVDSGADRTVLSTDILGALQLPVSGSPESLAGVGGRTAAVLVETQIRMTRENGTTVLFKGKITAVTDPTALDMSVLGREIINHFVLIIDRPQDIVCLLGQGHRYLVVPG